MEYDNKTALTTKPVTITTTEAPKWMSKLSPSAKPKFAREKCICSGSARHYEGCKCGSPLQSASNK